jgi:hypothetical protein
MNWHWLPGFRSSFSKDPDPFYADPVPDPAFHSYLDPDPDSALREGDAIL